MKCIVDTNIFNKLLDGSLMIDDLPSNTEFVATHVQVDELNNTKDSERRAQLFLKFAELRPELVETESLIWGVTRWGMGRWGVEEVVQKIESELNSLNKGKKNNILDALIAEVAIVNGWSLLTADTDLAEVAQRNVADVFQYELRR
jgi:predicted nuclease of predicted toxin-antitoxin system